MRPESLQTVELLSLESMHGRYAMKLGVGRDGGPAGAVPELEAELDEATFIHLQKLDPLSEGRVRLSLYAKYDPFRQTYFSSIVKLNKEGSRSYYFDCSAEFEAMLGGLRSGDMTSKNSMEPPHTGESSSVLLGVATARHAAAVGPALSGMPMSPVMAASPAVPVESAVPQTVSSAVCVATVGSSAGPSVAAAGTLVNAQAARLFESAGVAPRNRMNRWALNTLRLLLLSVMFLLVWFEIEGRIYIDDAKALSEHQAVVVEGSGEGAKQGAALEVSAMQTSGDVDSSLAGTVKDGTKTGEGEIALASDVPTTSLAASNAVVGVPTADSATSNAGSGVVTTSADTEAHAGESNTLAAGFDQMLVELITLDGDAPLYSLPDGYVALTFDDGPSDYTKAIVDLLRERGVAGTFLFVGRHAEKYPKEAAYAAEQGMAVGNHSWNHSNLTKFSIDAISADIEKTNQTIAKRSDSPVSVFRPPYGATNDDVEIAVQELGMKMLMWNRDPEDWKADTSADIVRYFKQLSPSGGIYVMHEKKATLGALPDIIDYLLEQGLKFAVFQ